MPTFIRYQFDKVGYFITDTEGNLLSKGLGETKSEAKKNAYNLMGKVEEAQSDQDKGILVACRVWAKKDFRNLTIKTSPKGDLSRIIRHMANAWVREFRIQKKLINFGSCEDFAFDVKRAFPAVEIVRQDHHCYVMYGGKCYDAECPDGADSYNELPFYKDRL